ncbi:MAG TPA: hypothetical protein VIJ50_02250, partial [Solirubrobacteraceae bacterium]
MSVNDSLMIILCSPDPLINVSMSCPALGRSHPALHERAADLDVGDRRVDLKMPPLECNGLADANARGGQEP